MTAVNKHRWRLKVYGKTATIIALATVDLDMYQKQSQDAVNQGSLTLNDDELMRVLD
jgi:hypothetical protein